MAQPYPTLTTAQIEQLTCLIHQVFQASRRGHRGDWDAQQADQIWRDTTITDLHALAAPQARPYAGRALAKLWQRTLQRYLVALTELNSRRSASSSSANWRLRGQLTQFQSQLAACRDRCAALEAELALRPAPHQVIVPTQQLTVRSELDRALLRRMGAGESRSWRLQQELVDLGLTSNPKSVTNALRRLTQNGFIDDYRQAGQAQGWSLGPGRPRRLVVLAPPGELWLRTAENCTPQPAELLAMLQRHSAVQHAVGVMEAREHLTAAGYAIDADPQPLLVDDTAPWAGRAEPDLMLKRDGPAWPVEVQREVHPRQLEKWNKTLHLRGRLILILFTRTKLARQVKHLQRAVAHGLLLPGTIRLTALEVLEASPDWEWQVVRVTAT